MTSPASPKRNYDDAELEYTVFKPEVPERTPVMPQPPRTADTTERHPVKMEPNPLMGTGTIINSTLTHSLPPSSTAEKPAKRVKLSVEEKEAKRIEKEAKDRQKAEDKLRREEEKARKEEEKAIKDAEKAVKEEERRKAKHAKEEQAKLREEEKQRKEDERMKKARVCACEAWYQREQS